MLNFKKEIAKYIAKVVELNENELESFIEIPKDNTNGDYTFNITLKLATTDQPSGDQTISADWVGTYEGTKDEVTYQVVLTAETITINGTETTITEIDGIGRFAMILFGTLFSVIACLISFDKKDK